MAVKINFPYDVVVEDDASRAEMRRQVADFSRRARRRGLAVEADGGVSAFVVSGPRDKLKLFFQAETHLDDGAFSEMVQSAEPPLNRTFLLSSSLKAMRKRLRR